MAERRRDLIIEDAILRFTNFEGREKRNPHNGKIINQAGSRNFNVIIPEDMVDTLVEDGWNVKILEPKEDGDEALHMLKVNVSYRYREPDIRMYSGRKEVYIHEDTVSNLDYADIEAADVVIHPSEYIKDDGSTGLSGYCTELRVVVRPRPFDEKYADYMSPQD